MPVIKRYPNRKLYDTQAKQYITLEDLTHKIRQGEEIQVIDNASGEDITAMTLSQIIYEQARRSGEFLPRAILSNLIQVGGDRLSTLHRELLSHSSFLSAVDEEIRSRVRELVQRGELLDVESQQILNKLLVTGSEVERKAIERAVQKHHIPTGADLEDLNAQLAALESKLDEMLQSSQAAGE